MLQAVTGAAWAAHTSVDHRIYLKLDDRLLRPGSRSSWKSCTFDGETWAWWLLSQTGEVLGVMKGACA